MIPRTRQEFEQALRELPGVHLPSVEDDAYNVFRAIPKDNRQHRTFLAYLEELGVSREDAETVYQSLMHKEFGGEYFYVSRNRPLAFLGVGRIAQNVGAEYRMVPMDFYKTRAWEALITTKPLGEEDMYSLELWPPTDEQMVLLTVTQEDS